MKFKIRYMKGQLSPFGAVAEGAGTIAEIGLTKVALTAAQRLAQQRRARAKKKGKGKSKRQTRRHKAVA